NGRPSPVTVICPVVEELATVSKSTAGPGVPYDEPYHAAPLAAIVKPFSLWPEYGALLVATPVNPIVTGDPPGPGGGGGGDGGGGGGDGGGGGGGGGVGAGADAVTVSVTLRVVVSTSEFS